VGACVSCASAGAVVIKNRIADKVRNIKASCVASDVLGSGMAGERDKLAHSGGFELLYRLPRLAGRALVKLYRYTLSPLIGFHCRHLPTCSEYADEAIDRYGLWAGSWMTLARLLRCQPWGTSGIDRVPAERPARARWYLPWRYARWRGTNSAT
jgi:putative membrane protein insertion efficiency factor